MARFNLAGMGYAAEGMSHMRDNLDRHRANAQGAELSAVKLRALQQAEADRKRAAQDNAAYADSVVFGAGDVVTNPIGSPRGGSPAAYVDPTPASTEGDVQTFAYKPEPAPAGKPISTAAPKPAATAPRAPATPGGPQGSLPAHFYNTGNPNTGRAIVDDVLAGYDAAAPALIEKYRRGGLGKLTPEEQQILGNAPSTPERLRRLLKYTPVTGPHGPTVGVPVAAPTATGAPPAAAPSQQPAPMAARPGGMQVPPELQGQRDQQAAALVAANEYNNDPAAAQADIATLQAELRKPNLNAEARVMLMRELTVRQQALQHILSSPATGAPAAPAPAMASTPAGVPPAPAQGAPAAPAPAPMELDPNGQYATVASTGGNRARAMRMQEARFLQMRIRNSHDPAVQEQLMTRLQQLATEDYEANIYDAYLGAKTGNKAGWDTLAGLIHQQTGSQVGFYAKDGQVAMYQQGPDGTPQIIDQGPIDTIANRLYQVLSPTMRAQALAIAQKQAEAEVTEAPKRNTALQTEQVKQTGENARNLLTNYTRAQIGRWMSDANVRSAMTRAGLNGDEIKGITVDPIEGRTLVRTTKGVFQLIEGKTDGDISTPDRLEPIEMVGFEPGAGTAGVDLGMDFEE